MSQKERVLRTPVYVRSWQKMANPILGEIAIPANSTLDVEDVFGGRSMCLLDELPTFGDGECADVEGVIYVAKRGVYSTPAGWICNYCLISKVAKLAREPDKQDKNVRRRLNPKTKLNLPLLDTDDNLTDFEDCDLECDAEYGWAGDEISNGDISDHGNEEGELLLSRYDKFNITQDDRVEAKHALRNKIDNDKYYVCASSTTNRLCIIWRKRESREMRKEHANAVGEISKIPGARTLYGSRTSKLGLHGMVECLQRARGWQEWHINVIRGWAGRLYFHVKKTY